MHFNAQAMPGAVDEVIAIARVFNDLAGSTIHSLSGDSRLSDQNALLVGQFYRLVDVAQLGINRARYGFMLGEDGMVMDDGVTIRLGEKHYFMHTTTGGAARVLAWMERWLQTEWPDLKVYLTSVTDHWATMAVVGPHSREVVAQLKAAGFNHIHAGEHAFKQLSYAIGSKKGM